MIKKAIRASAIVGIAAAGIMVSGATADARIVADGCQGSTYIFVTDNGGYGSIENSVKCQ